MSRIDLIIIGGFLGAGKTTSIVRIARHLLKMEKKIGIITNDQGSNLVDTNFLTSAGLSVLEVKEGCFCCNFDQFLMRIQDFTERDKPDIILAEPVGSCTDLVATIFRPLERGLTGALNLRPLSIVVDPRRLRKLMMEESSEFHSEINYLFRKQLEEADIIVLNKVDTLKEEEIDEMNLFIKETFKWSELINVSAKEDKNIDKWIEKLFIGSPSERVLDIDYTLYGDAEARLGWLNLTCQLEKDEEIDMNSIASTILDMVKDIFFKERYEIAHIKLYGTSEKDWLKASITSIYEDVNFDKTALIPDKRWNLIINARVDVEPEKLESKMQEVLDLIKKKYKVNIDEVNIQCFSPRFPVPRYRL